MHLESVRGVASHNHIIEHLFVSLTLLKKMKMQHVWEHLNKLKKKHPTSP